MVSPSGLIGRFQPDTANKIAIHAFWAALLELQAGSITSNQLRSAFNISTQAEISEYNALINLLQLGNVNATRFHGILILLEEGLYSPEVVRQILNGER